MKCIRVRNKIQIVKLKLKDVNIFFFFVVLFNFKPIFLLRYRLLPYNRHNESVSSLCKAFRYTVDI